MEGSDISATYNKDLSKLFKTGYNYDRVTVLVIYWQDAPHLNLKASFRQEGKAVGALFDTHFKYHVEYFEIPSKNSEHALDVRINELLFENRSDTCLLILHYGGHGDEDTANKRMSVWSLGTERGSPTVHWSELQLKLKRHPSEVLLLLDCCFAAQAARGYQSPIPENVELWAACGLNTKTVPPGPDSFTSLLIPQLINSIRSDGFVKISDAHRNFASNENKFAQTTPHFPLGTSKLTITLRALDADRIVTRLSSSDRSDVLIRFSLVNQDQASMNRTMNDIVQLFRNNPPQNISNAQIEDLTNSVSTLNQYITGESGEKTIVSFDGLAVPARTDVISRWTAFQETIRRVGSYMKASSKTFGTDCTLDTKLSTSCAEELVDKFGPVQKAIERGILSIPELAEKEALLEAMQDPQIVALGLGEMLELKVQAHFAEGSTVVNVDIPTVQQMDVFPRRILGILPDMPQLGKVLIEARKFEWNTNDKTLLAAKARLETLASLLHHSKPADFHALSCQGSFFEPSRIYGFILEVPLQARELSVSLHDLLARKVKVSKKPTLGQRFQVAYKIGEALMKWHLLDWVHQGIASYNIVFFYDEIDGVDYDNPYLCGFEYARKYSAPSTSRIVEDFDLNVYRHPDRQGVPNASHQKEHDIYSYGVLLLELGLWSLARSLFTSAERSSISSNNMAKRLRDTA